MKIIAVIISLSVALTGCTATSPVNVSVARSIPSNNLLEGYSGYSQPSPERCHVVIVRDSGAYGGAALVKFYVNGITIAKINSREKLDLYLAPGEYTFGVEPTPNLISPLNEYSQKVSLNEIYFYRISATPGVPAFVLQRSFAIQ